MTTKKTWKETLPKGCSLPTTKSSVGITSTDPRLVMTYPPELIPGRRVIDCIDTWAILRNTEHKVEKVVFRVHFGPLTDKCKIPNQTLAYLAKAKGLQGEYCRRIELPLNALVSLYPEEIKGLGAFTPVDCEVRKISSNILDFHVTVKDLKPGTKKPFNTRTKKENIEMKKQVARIETTAVPQVGKRIVQCEFPGTPNTLYAYYTDLADIAVGDMVVVSSPYCAAQRNYRTTRGIHYSEAIQGHPVVVKVKSVVETVDSINKASKWVIQKIDLDTYAQRISQEQSIKVLEAKIEQARKEAMKRIELEALKAASPELATLMAQLDALKS